MKFFLIFIFMFLSFQVGTIKGLLNFTSDCDSNRLLTFVEMRKLLHEKIQQAKLNPVVIEKPFKMNTLENMTFKVIIENIEPYVYINKGKDGNYELSGYIIEIWKTLEEELKFKSVYVNLTSCKGKTALKTGNADVMLTPVVLSSRDLDNFDHSMPIASSWFQFYMKRKEGQASSISYIKAWEEDLWLAFILTLVLLTLFVWIMEYIRKRCGIEFKERSTFKNKFGERQSYVNQKNNSSQLFTTNNQKYPSIGTCMLHVWGAVTQQGTRECPSKSMSGRLFSLVCLMFGWLMMTSYSAALVSRMAVRKTEPPPFNTLSEASLRKTHVICTRVNDFAYSTLFKARNTDQYIMPKWHGIVNAPPCVSEPKTSEDIRQSVCHKNVITLETSSIMSRILSPSLPCIATKMIKERLAYVYISLLVRKGFPYNRLISSYLLKLHCSGLIQKLQNRYLHKKLILKDPKYDLEITIQHVESILVLYSIAIVFSIAVLGTEIMVNINILNDDNVNYQSVDERKKVKTSLPNVII